MRLSTNLGYETVTSAIFNQDEFLNLPTEAIYDLIHPQQLSISLLVNGTRRWYISEYFNKPPTDNSYLPHYLNTVLIRLSGLLTMLTDHGLYRIFVPVYSEGQQKREKTAHQFLLRGIEALIQYPSLLKLYSDAQIAVRFYGDPAIIPETLDRRILEPILPSSGLPDHYIHYDINTSNPYNYILKLAYEFGVTHGRAPSWEDMLELYYGDREMRKLDILIAFNRMYSRLGLPHLLEGNDRIYMTMVTPLVLSQNALRRILYDYLYNTQDVSRDYINIHPNELYRLKSFYNANMDTVVGLTRKFEDFCYPLPGPTWPENMIDEVEPSSISK